jgi:imidazolonepropionase-like amidohydrolase
VLRDGLIEAVGRDVAVPADAIEIESRGQWIYAGFVDPDARGQAAAASRDEGRPGAAEAARPDVAGALHPLPSIRPERRALDALTPWSGERRREAEAWRVAGYTAIAVAPPRGVLRGSSALVQVHDDLPVAEIVLREDALQVASFETASFGRAYPTSVMGAAAALRQVLLDAQRQTVWEARWADDPTGIARPERTAAFEAMAPVLAHKIPLMVELSDPADLDLADRIAREFELDLVVSGTGHEWEVAERAREAGRTVVLPLAFPDKPDLEEGDAGLLVPLRTLRRHAQAAAGPGRLHAAGVRLAFTTRGLKSLADVLPNLRKVVAAGLPEDAALAALTTEPARVVGAGRVLGTLEPGRIANLIVCDGSLFQERTRIVRTYVDGTEYRVPEKTKPKGDPNAVVDPRGTWSVVLELGRSQTARAWTITGSRGALAGTAETASGIKTFDRVTLEGNLLTVRFTTDRGTVEATVVIQGDRFEGTAEAGTRSGKVTGTRTSPPEER